MVVDTFDRIVVRFLVTRDDEGVDTELVEAFMYSRLLWDGLLLLLLLLSDGDCLLNNDFAPLTAAVADLVVGAYVMFSSDSSTS